MTVRRTRALAVLLVVALGACGGGGNDEPQATGANVNAESAAKLPPPPSPEVVEEARRKLAEFEAERQRNATSTTTAPVPKTTIGPGIYRVGIDIEPGTYRSPGPSGTSCYFARLSNLSAGGDNIIANGRTEGPAVVTIARSDVGFETSGCRTWEKVS